MTQFGIIEKLGGRLAVYTHLRARGLVGTKSAVNMWHARDRGVIPGDAARELMRLAEERGISYTAGDFELRADAGEVAA